MKKFSGSQSLTIRNCKCKRNLSTNRMFPEKRTKLVRLREELTFSHFLPLTLSPQGESEV